MKTFIFFAICISLSGSYGADDTDGVGAFAYQDSTGNRYGGTYGLKNGQVVDSKGNFPPDFSPPTFPDFDNFIPEYFRNLETLLQEALPFYSPPTFMRPRSFIRRPNFNSNRTFVNSVDQNLAYNAAKKAFELASNQVGYIPYIASRFQIPFANNFGGFGGFENMPGPQRFPGFGGFQVPDFERDGNVAFARAAFGPNFSQQTAAINPANPNNPNVNKINRVESNGPNNYKSVSSSSQVSSAVGPDGKMTSSRRAQTTLNNNGEISSYTVES